MPDSDIFVLKSGNLGGDSKSDTVHCNLCSVSRDSYTLPGCMIKRHNIHVNVFTSGKQQRSQCSTRISTGADVGRGSLK